MGIVYIAAAQGPAGFSKLVAIKELKPDLVQDESFLTMFLDEARIAARLNHPNIVQTNDVDECEGRHFIAMEYLDGRSFYKVLQQFAPGGGFPLRLSLSVLRDVLSALDYAHELADVDGRPFGFVHRDVSPHNIFVTFDGHTKVIDFGIAKARDSSLETKTGVLKGRVSYMAPEQLTHRADRRSDIFSVGAILFEVVTGRRLWAGMHEMEILAHLTRADIPQLDAARPDAPPALLAICKQALAGKLDDRFATAAEMRDRLDDHLWSNGGAPQAREVAGTLMDVFGGARQKQRELIEKYLARLQANPSGESERIETLAVSDGTHHGVETSASRSSSSAPSRSQPSEAELPELIEQSMKAARGTVPSRVIDEVPNLLLKHRNVIAAAAASAVLIGIIIGLGFGRGERTAPIAATPIAPVERSPAPSQSPGATAVAQSPPTMLPAPALPEMILLSVSVAPPQARVLIDGEMMPSNPFLGRFAKSAATHHVRAVAPGYLTKERLLSFSENVMVDLNLTPKPAAPAPEPQPKRHEPPPARHVAAPPVRAAAVAQPQPPPPPAAAPRPAPPADIQPRAEGPRRRAIDSTNPYGDDK